MCLRSWILIEVKWELISGKYNTKLHTNHPKFQFNVKECYWGIKKNVGVRGHKEARASEAAAQHYSRGDSSFFTTFVNLYSPRVVALRHSKLAKERRHHQQLGKSLKMTEKKPLLINARNCIYPPLHVIMNQWLERQTSCWSGKLTLDAVSWYLLAR